MTYVKVLFDFTAIVLRYKNILETLLIIDPSPFDFTLDPESNLLTLKTLIMATPKALKRGKKANPSTSNGKKGGHANHNGTTTANGQNVILQQYSTTTNGLGSIVQQRKINWLRKWKPLILPDNGLSLDEFIAYIDNYVKVHLGVFNALSEQGVKYSLAGNKCNFFPVQVSNPIIKNLVPAVNPVVNNALAQPANPVANNKPAAKGKLRAANNPVSNNDTWAISVTAFLTPPAVEGPHPHPRRLLTKGRSKKSRRKGGTHLIPPPPPPPPDDK